MAKFTVNIALIVEQQQACCGRGLCAGAESDVPRGGR